MSEKQPETRKVEDAHGTIYTTCCPRCGRQVAERKAGEAVCTCGAKVELKS